MAIASTNMTAAEIVADLTTLQSRMQFNTPEVYINASVAFLNTFVVPANISQFTFNTVTPTLLVVTQNSTGIIWTIHGSGFNLSTNPFLTGTRTSETFQFPTDHVTLTSTPHMETGNFTFTITDADLVGASVQVVVNNFIARQSTVTDAGIVGVLQGAFTADGNGTSTAFSLNNGTKALSMSGFSVINNTVGPVGIVGPLFVPTALSGNDKVNITSNTGTNLFGFAGNDILNGNTGNDTLIGGSGIDVMAGGNGNDDYYVDIAKVGVGATATIKLQDTVTEGAGLIGDTDLIYLTNNSGGTGNTALLATDFNTTSTITMAANIEGLDAQALTDFKLNITGNASNNRIWGNNTTNVLDGGAGIDTLEGGAGNDTYLVDLKTGLLATTTNITSTELQDTIIDSSGDSDTLKLRGAATFTNPATISLIDSFTDIENLDVSLTGATKLNLIGSNANNYLTGNAANNTLEGRDGNDTLDGGTGADSMAGGNGDDTYYVNVAGDIIDESTSDGTDTVIAKLASGGTYTLSEGLENLTAFAGAVAMNLTGTTLANTLTGNSGANILNGNGGLDVMLGGDGADTYITEGDDTITETNALAAGGIDLVKSSGNFILGNNIENLTIVDTVDNAGNTITAEGNMLANTIKGHTGSDVITGGAGKDLLTGGKGDDIYYVDLAQIGTGATATVGLQDVITELANPISSNIEGTDTIKLTNLTGSVINGSPTALNSNNFSTTSTITLAAAIEHINAIDAAGFKLNLTGNALNNSIEGNNVANVLLGLAGNDTLIGGAGNDTMDGGVGQDELRGGADNDTYIMDLSAPITAGATSFSIDNLLDVVTENANEGNDTLKIRGTFGNTNIITLIAENYIANVEGLDISLTGAAKINLTGDSADNNLVGNVAANTIIGNDGNDTLDGGAGADILVGGIGDDTYVVDNIGDSVTELVGEGNNDTIRSSIAINLNSTISATNLALKYADIEHVTLTGTAAINATGNAGNNTLTGNDGANIIDGGAGADAMNGGKGADTYIVDDAGDTVTETLTIAQGGGIDLVKSSGNFMLGNNIEDLTIIDTVDNAINTIIAEGNTLANTIKGHIGGDIITGGAGKDTLIGGKGNDYYYVDLAKVGTGATATIVMQDTVIELTGPAGSFIEGTDTIVLTNLTGGIDANGNAISLNADDFATTTTFTVNANVEEFNAALTGNFKLNITGNALANLIIGNDANNILDGGLNDGKQDYLAGGAGNDTLVVDMVVAGAGAASTFSFIDGIDGGYGIDTLKLRGAINYGTLFTETLNVDELRFYGLEGLDVSLTGATRFNLAGNSTDNILIGNAFTNIIIAADGNDTLDGGVGNDSLIGGNGNDSLIGGLGIDNLNGGDGDDTYVVDSQAEAGLITDTSGVDTVQSSISLSLVPTAAQTTAGLAIENLTLKGVAAINGTGNFLDNTLIGNAAANTLDGGAGYDTIDGGLGNDVLIGGLGGDLLRGGLGTDRFDFNFITESSSLNASIDTVADFSHVQLDKIDLSTIDAKSSTAINDAFNFIGNNVAFSNVAGQLMFDTATNSVYGDINGDAVADFQIILTGVTSLVAADFIL